MKITALVENTCHSDLKAAHGLSLYIETEKHKIMFDAGPDETFYENGLKLGVPFEDVDIIIISHGHYDHGGGLEKLLEVNKKAPVYIRRSAFEPHYARGTEKNRFIGINPKLMEDPRMVLLDGDYRIDDELFLFAADRTDKCRSYMNDVLFDDNGIDPFGHEHSLIISGETPALIMGCGHTGVVNIMEKAAEFMPKICVGGFHLYSNGSKETVGEELLSEIAAELSKYSDTVFYTCHCTGEKAYHYLENKMDNIRYLSCGEKIEL